VEGSAAGAGTGALGEQLLCLEYVKHLLGTGAILWHRLHAGVDEITDDLRTLLRHADVPATHPLSCQNLPRMGWGRVRWCGAGFSLVQCPTFLEGRNNVDGVWRCCPCKEGLVFEERKPHLQYGAQKRSQRKGCELEGGTLQYTLYRRRGQERQCSAAYLSCPRTGTWRVQISHRVTYKDRRLYMWQRSELCCEAMQGDPAMMPVYYPQAPQQGKPINRLGVHGSPLGRRYRP